MRDIDYSRGGYGNATEDFQTSIDDTSEEIRTNIYAKEDFDKIHQAVELLTSVVNHASIRATASYINLAMAHEHRTLQAQAVSALIRFLEVYQGASYDLRNAAAVDAAQKLSAVQDTYIPLI